MKVFGRDPAVILEFVKALLVGLSVTVLPLSAEVQTGILVFLVALFGVFKAFTTKDKVTGEVAIGPTVFTDLITAVAALLLGFGVEIGPEKVAALLTLVSAAVVMLQRSQLTPALGVNNRKAVVGPTASQNRPVNTGVDYEDDDPGAGPRYV